MSIIFQAIAEGLLETLRPPCNTTAILTPSEYSGDWILSYRDSEKREHIRIHLITVGVLVISLEDTRIFPYEDIDLLDQLQRYLDGL